MRGRAIAQEKRAKYWTKKPYFVEYITEFEINLDYAKQTLFCRYWTPEFLKDSKLSRGQHLAEFALTAEDLKTYSPRHLYHPIYGEELAEAVARLLLMKDSGVETESKLKAAIDAHKILKKHHPYKRTFLVRFFETPPINWILFWLLIAHDCSVILLRRQDLVLLKDGYTIMQQRYELSSIEE
ncbi:MAG: hypothetical protein J0M35_18080 [Candidatus Obscuribacter phosphatis]|uniref:Uncharacterized protein n=1 Tax=Candidatus Obscuribacter phosphatis TaxID=1906157 RepID=A0A8J7P9N8_9BACT|nr:hypothetical protein [Candidatus Obscuribacter phosphatis]